MKICSKCKLEKPLADFNKYAKSKDRHQPYCRTCSKDHYHNNRDRHITNVASRNQRVRKKSMIKLREYLANNPCIDCGESDPVVLEFDHVRGQKVRPVSQLVTLGYSWLRIEEEIDKCEVRCANCHRRKTAKQLGYYAYLIEGEIVPIG